MFLDHLNTLGLLQHDPSTDILKQFPLSVRQTLASQVVNVLLDSNAGARALTSVAHVRWAMESVGASFTLPMESEEIMSTAIELYRRWLLDSSKRPSPINSEPQFFIRQILCHYSLLFEPRTALPDSLDTQAALCKRALNIYHALGRESSALDEETWEIFLKLLLGIADSLLSLPESEEGLTKRLCSHVLKVLFELWLYSSTSEADMWGSLLHLVPRWVHHLPTINQWLAVCKGLTERAISFMYGPEEGRECVLIQLEGSKEIVTMDGLQEEHVFYAWHRMLHAIGDPNSIANPRIHHAAFKGIDTLVDLFLQVGRKSGKAERQELKPPEGNTILHIFGNWLFDAAMQRRDGFEEGRAVAVKTLCNIFSTCKSSPFNTVYLSRFYACLSQVLGESTEVMIAGLTNAGILFPCELPGFRILTPAFVYALNRVLLRRLHFEHAGAQENVRRECLRILGYLISTPNHFSDTPFSRATPKPPVINTPASPKDTLSAKLPEIKTFRQVDDHLVVLLGESLVYETAGGNVRPLLSLCYAFARETHLKRPDFTLHVIHTIVQKITHAQWLTGHCVDAYRVLGFFSAFYTFLPDPDETANFVVSSLANMFASEAIGDLLTRLAPSEFEIHMMEALECITCWLMVGPPWIYQYHKTKAAVINAIMSVLHSSSKPGVQGERELKTSLGTSESDQSRKDRKTKKLISRKGQRGPQQAKAPNVAPLHPAPKLREPSPRLREVAAHALATMINHMGNYPNPSGTTCLSTLLSEEDVLKLLPEEVAAKIDPAQFVRYFISGSTIYTVIDRPNNGDGYVTLIVRDRTGKYAWDLQSVSLSQEDEKLLEGVVLAHPKEISLEPYTIPVPPKGEADLPNMAKFVDNKRSLFVSAQAKQTEKEKKYLRKHDWGLNADIRCFPVWASPSPYAESESKFIHGRMLLSQLGFLSPQQRSNFHQIDQSPAFFRSLKNLDRTPERECISVGVLYLGKGQTKKKVWANSAEHVSRSPAYQRFLDASGWTVDVATHPGWVGQLDRTGKTGARTLYYADYNKEMVYLVGSMMNTDVKTKKKLIKSSSNTALILWTEEEIDLVMWYDWVFAICPIVIAVRPLPSGLFYTCTLNKNAEVIHVGPLQEEGVVGMNELGVLVRETALSAYKGLKRSLADYSHPYTVRAGMINDIGAKFAMPNLTPQQYFNSLFSHLPSDKLFPYSPSSPPAAVLEAARRKPRPRASLVPETAEYRLPSPPPSYRAMEVSPRVSVESSDSSVGGSRRTSEDKGSPRKRRSSAGLATSTSSSETVPIAMSASAPFQSMPSLSSFTSPGDSGATGSSPSSHSSPSLGSNSVSIRPKDVQFEKHAAMPLPTRQAPVPSSKSGGDAKSGAVAALKKNEASGGRSSLPAVAVSEPPPRPLASSVSSGPAATAGSGSRQVSSEPPFDRIPTTPGADDPLVERKASKEKKSKKDATAVKKNKKHKSDGGVSIGGSSEDTATATMPAAGSGSVSCDNLAAVTEGESSKKRERREKRASRKSLSHEITHAIITHANAGASEPTTPSLATSSSPSLPSPPREDKGAKVVTQRTVVQPFVPPAGAAGLPEPTRQAPERPTLP